MNKKASEFSLERLLFLVLSPLLCFLAIVALAPYMKTSASGISFFGKVLYSAPLYFAYLVITQGHVFLIFQRSFMNQEVFQRFKKRIVGGTTLVFAAVFFSGFFFLLLSFINIFWTQYHFMRQNFGVSRLLGKKQRLASVLHRRIELAFIALTFFVPPLCSVPSLFFDPTTISKRLVSLGGTPLIYTVMAILESAVQASVRLEMPIVILSFVYLAYLFKKESREKLLYSATLMAASWIPWIFLNPGMGLVIYIVLHSVQYYYLVGKNSGAGTSLRAGLSYLVWVMAALAFGAVSLRWGSTSDVEGIAWNFQTRALTAFSVAVNLLHFWMDGFVWKRWPASASGKSSAIAA